MASEARIAANRRNSLRSTGPKSPEGKERSRRNGLKHGLTGSGVVLAEGDADEVGRRAEAIRAELAPRSALGEVLVGQLATLSVRMERGARQESAAIAARVRHAAEAFDEARFVEAEVLFEGLADDPRGGLRRLRRSPEGVDRLVAAWQGLRDDLTRRMPAWTASHMEAAAHLTGFGSVDARESPVGVLSRAAWGDFQRLTDLDGAGLAEDARRAWARDRLVERIDEEIAGLEADRESLDREAIELDRLEAGDRALFDPSKEATLARRYEAEARRGFFRSLEQYRRVEAEVAAARLAPQDEPEASPESARAPDGPLASSRERPARTNGAPMASSWEGPASAIGDPQPAGSRAGSTRDADVRRPDGRLSGAARPTQAAG